MLETTNNLGRLGKAAEDLERCVGSLIVSTDKLNGWNQDSANDRVRG